MRKRYARREWELVTRPYAQKHFRNDIVIGEIPIAAQRTFDGVVIKRRGRGFPVEPVHYQDIPREERHRWRQMLPGGRLIALQSKVERLGFSVLGQALMSALMLRTVLEPPPSSAHGLALCTDLNDELLEIVRSEPYRRYVDVDVEVRAEPPARPTREHPTDPSLLETHLPARIASYRSFREVRVTNDETVEALYVDDERSVGSAQELRGRTVALVHTSPRMYLSLLGHAVFGAAAVARHEPASLESLVLVRHDVPLLSNIARAFAAEANIALDVISAPRRDATRDRAV